MKSLKSNTFASNIAKIATGTAIAQIIPIAIQPFLRRMYLPEDFGLLGVYTNTISILCIFLSFRYSQTINIPKNNVLAINVFSLSVLITFVVTIISYVLILFFDSLILDVLGIPQNRSAFLYFIPFSAFLFSLFEIISFWLIRMKQFKEVAINKIYRRAIEGVVNICMGLKGSFWGLIVGDISGNVANVLSGCKYLKKGKIPLKNISLKKMLYAAKHYSFMPKYNLFPQLLNTLCISLPAIFINKLYSSEIAGYFNLTMIVLSIPIALIGKSISDVLTQRLAEKRNSMQSVTQDIYQLVKWLALISVIMVLFLTLIGPWAFSLVFGNIWGRSGVFAQILVWGAAIRLITSPLNVVFIIFEEVKVFAFWQILFFAFILSLLFLGFLSIEHYLVVISVMNFIFYSIAFFMVKHTISRYEKLLVK